MAVINNPINYPLCNFNAYFSTSPSLSNVSQLKFDSTYLNDGSNYNTTNWTYTVPITGPYLFNMNLSLGPTLAAGLYCDVQIRVNGSTAYTLLQFEPSGASGAGTITLSSSIVASLTAAQAITFYISQAANEGGVINAGSNVTGIFLI